MPPKKQLNATQKLAGFAAIILLGALLLYASLRFKRREEHPVYQRPVYGNLRDVRDGARRL